MTSSVTAPLEKQFGQVPGLSQMTSISSFGSSLITLQFSLELNIDIAEQEVQAAINAAGTFLPKGFPLRRFIQQNQSGGRADSDAGDYLGHVAASERGRACRNAHGAANFAAAGRRAGQHQRRPAAAPCGCRPTLLALASYGLSLETLRTALSAAPMSTRPRETSTAPTRPGPSTTTTSCRPAAEYAPIIIAYRNGAPVRLSDVATIIDGAENTKQAAWVNTTPAIILNIQRQPGTNIIGVVDTIQALLPQIQASLPASRLTCRSSPTAPPPSAPP